MDKYLKLQCVKGLLMSLEEQLGMRFEKNGLGKGEKTVIVDKYHDAILEQLEQSEDENKRKLILTLKKQGIISEEQKMELLYPKHENVGNETPEWGFNIIINGTKHIIHTTEDCTIDWNEIVLLSDLAKTGAEILTVTYTKGDTTNGGYSNGTLEVNELIKVKEGMIFNIKKQE